MSEIPLLRESVSNQVRTQTGIIQSFVNGSLKQIVSDFAQVFDRRKDSGVKSKQTALHFLIYDCVCVLDFSLARTTRVV